MTTAPWWGVPVIAGGFLIIGGFLTFIFNFANDRRKIRIEDGRRFESEIIDLYEKLDDAIEGLHNNAGATDPVGLQREKDEYWRLYLQILRAKQRLQIIAPRELSRIAEEMRMAALRLNPDYTGEYNNAMAVLTDAEEYFRKALRRHLRIRDERVPGENRTLNRIERRLPFDWQIRLEERRRGR